MGKLIKCKECGKIFERKSRQIYCGKECLALATNNKRKKKRLELHNDDINHIREAKKICANCGKAFYGIRNTKYCSKVCRYEYQDKLKTKRQKEKKQKRNKKYSKNEQPCWTCKKACGGCRWSDKLKPVKGWVAIKVKRKDDTGEKNLTGYKIISCPEHEEG